MASYVAKKVSRKYAGGKLAAYEPTDPHYETYTDAQGRTKNRKRAMPAGLSKRDERILRSVRRRAHYLDKGFSICGFRFGWTAILGLIPFLGDIVSFLLGYSLVLRKCKQADLPPSLSQRMTFNQTVGLGIGLTPLVGDLAAAVFKANSRNAALLEAFLIQRAAKQTEGNTAAEETAAQGALETRISGKTGDSLGGGAAVAAAPARTTAPGGGTGEISASTAAAKPSAQNKSFYGWGSSGAGGAETKPLNPPQQHVAVNPGTSTQPRMQ